MSLTLILRSERSESSHAAEFRYLKSQIELAARTAFGEIEVLDLPAAGSAGGDSERARKRLAQADRALVLGSDRVLIGAASLREMAAGLAAGRSGAAIPYDLAEVPAVSQGPIHTLRGYELLEGRILAGEAATGPARSSFAPVALLNRRGLEKALEALGPEGFAGDPGALEELGLSTLAAGLFHEFVDYYGEVRRDILPYLPPGARDLLEVGCGRGVTGRYLREELGCRVTGVELNPVVAREAAENLDAVIQGDIESLEIAGQYDAVLALELFEHLVEPETFLTRARSWLRPGGRIVLSVPNVGHHAVVEDLLAGRWDYLPIGLLCYTHLRFFTRRTLEDWLRRCGYESFELVPQETEESPHIEALIRLSEDPAAGGLEIDRRSLKTKGFYVVIEA